MGSGLDDDEVKDYVTLAYEGGQQEKAPQIIIAASSPFFQKKYSRSTSIHIHCTGMCERNKV